MMVTVGCWVCSGAVTVKPLAAAGVRSPAELCLSGCLAYLGNGKATIMPSKNKKDAISNLRVFISTPWSLLLGLFERSLKRVVYFWLLKAVVLNQATHVPGNNACFS